MGTIKFFASALMVGLFTIAIITWASMFAADNNSAVSLSSDSELQAINSTLSSTITIFASDVNGSGNTFISTTQDAGDQSATSGGQFKSGIGGALSMATEAARSGFEQIFGEDDGFAIFLTALLSILGFMLFAYGWKFWRGNPD